MPIITLTTDFGHSDAYVGAMKGVILGICLDAVIVDACHNVPPQDILAGALALEAAAPYFPHGTIHVGVVDPGVGSERAAVAIKTPNALYVGPDNGLFTLVLQHERPTKIVRLTNPRFQLPTVSSTFHGRDIFAPAAAHLGAGVPLTDLGETARHLAKLEVPAPKEVEGVLEVQVLHADRFGNLITTLTAPALRAWLGDRKREQVSIEVAGEKIEGIRSTYADVHPGSLIAYVGSGGRVEIGLRNGNAAQSLGVLRGATATLRA